MTLEELRDRMRAARIEIPEHRLELVRRLLTDALQPIHALDSRAVRTLEPAVHLLRSMVMTEEGDERGRDDHGR